MVVTDGDDSDTITLMAAQSQTEDGPERESLRDAQRRVTRERIVGALTELIEQEHPFEVSMADVAARAGVSEPTLYRHFATKRDLFAALAGSQYRHVTEGLAPASVDELVAAVRTVYQRAEAIEPTVRWTLAAPDPERVPRPNADARIAMLRTALDASLAGMRDSDQEHLIRLALLLTSPIAWLYWHDYLDLSPDAATDSARWALKQLAPPPTARSKQGDPG